MASAPLPRHEPARLRAVGVISASHGTMLTIAACRRLLGRGCTLTDAEVEMLRDELTALANVAIDAFVEAKDR